MHMALPVPLQLLELCLFGFAIAVLGYSDDIVSPSRSLISGFHSSSGISSSAHGSSSATGSLSQPDGAHVPLGPLHPKLFPLPATIEAHTPAWSPSASTEFSPSNTSSPPVAADRDLMALPQSPIVVSPPLYAPPPLLSQEHASSTPSAPAPNNMEPVNKPSVSGQTSPAPISSPSRNLPQTPPSFHPTQAPSLLPTSPTQVEPNSKPPSSVPVARGPVSTSKNLPQTSPSVLPSPGGISFQTSPQTAPAVPQEKPSVMPPTTHAISLGNPPHSSPAVRQSAPSPQTNKGNVSNNDPPISEPINPGPVAAPSRNSQPNSSPPNNSPFQSNGSHFALPPLTNKGNISNNVPPTLEPINMGPVAAPSRNSQPSSSPPNSSPFHSNGSHFAPPPQTNKGNLSNNEPATLEPKNPGPVAAPSRNSQPSSSPPNNSPFHSNSSHFAPLPETNKGNVSNNEPPISEPINTGLVAAPRNSQPSSSPPKNSPIHSKGSDSFPRRAKERNPPDSRTPISVPTAPAPIVSTVGKFPDSSPMSPTLTPDHASSPSSALLLRQKDRPSVLPPTNETYHQFLPINHSPEKSPATAKAPSTDQATRHSVNASAPHSSSPASHSHKKYHYPALSPEKLSHKHPGERNRTSRPASVSGNLLSPAPPTAQGDIGSPSVTPSRRKRYSAPPPLYPGSSTPPYHLPIRTPTEYGGPSPSPSVVTSSQTKSHFLPPKVSSPESSPKIPEVPPLLPSIQWFPPPPNKDCAATTCTEPYTNTVPGSPCGCVWPMQVGLRLSVALYTFFPLVSELAAEVASGAFMKQSQVRIMGANAASDHPDKTIVLMDLVPIGDKFYMPTAFLTFQRFWHKQVSINASLFGDYDVLYVRYPGLPPSPPLPPNIGIIDNGPHSSENNPIKPLAVDVHKRLHTHGLSRGMIAIVVLSAAAAFALFSAIAFIFLLRYRDRASQPASTPRGSLEALTKPSGSAGSMNASALSYASLSFDSSVIAYNGSAKTFTAAEVERATDSFDASRVLGEGGFGLVYYGILKDGTKVAIKVLKRADQQGSREFFAEVEMLTRLHHKNLVKLIGICTEERLRCLIYELIPNGSVESHLHGVDKESAPLDWDARIKIALGAARGLAYLHEDSSPRVIHRDFKASNILLEHDFTPKVSDFGLARTALDEEGHHISTHVVGTFGYVAPEYAMTGHLLVKSDVYSYGVVLLELLTGRKPVDMSQPPGQENLVAWSRPFLTSRQGLEAMVDPSLGPDVPLDSVAKVATIASMCVQPEVSHRPFMGEVVQALKLVSNECDEAKEELGSRSSNSSVDLDAKVSTDPDPLQSLNQVPHYDSGFDEEMGVSVSVQFDRNLSRSFRRHSSSGERRSVRGSVSEPGVMFRFWSGSR